ncbi:bifunctional tetrahydrofolate synthase/dihydrofolate synthase [Aquisalimonas asiatica]|uniref:Dihydrofolate synthase/folylpolyglutamate synthase n=1 Tax=Aquisalimonas asiatica TaxID=406100 RepID=A0A1H8RP36_9GAMM|nr:bifunctional tetrahydrofolate synthase/dihydrofolate synthase [Aquisalimonas asiatica]SEO67934.1 dihydrofolate synthase / folylpolyglutamate synthase [Aquisalimonas asiatica]
MRFDTLDQWLHWQAGLHPRAIDPGLERVGEVADRLALRPSAMPVITVAGTNGKGSSVALLEAMLRAGGYATGAYTSPHLLRYNERIRINGDNATDAGIMAAFDAIDQARGEITLSYFEFGTLAALWLCRESGVDVALLEVGLGGRLDAVNCVDPDVALITSIGLDHAEWLGTDREHIGREKAGILRQGTPAVFAGDAMPDAIRGIATDLDAPLRVAEVDYTWGVAADGSWSWRHGDTVVEGLPQPALPGAMQYRNAAGVLAALNAIGDRLPLHDDALHDGLRQVQLPGRLHVRPGSVEWLFDVAHNGEAVAVLAAELARRPVSGRCFAVFGIMARKELAPVLDALSGRVDAWCPLALPDEDMRPAADVAAALRERGDTVVATGEPETLRQWLDGAVQPGDRVLVFGSFRTVEEMMRVTGMADG